MKFLTIFLILIFLNSCNGEEKDVKKGKAKFTNHLINETSPYLLQHAHNPVDWHPWGKKAFDRAKKENKPIFLSIGYAACHWCHVMEHESFADEKTAKVMNENFICIKVDREERPDVDRIYMNYMQLTQQRGGWPLNVVLTPERKPFFGGTYFPPESKFGRIGFKELLGKLTESWKTQKEGIVKYSEKVTVALNNSLDTAVDKEDITATDLSAVVKSFETSFDAEDGGFGKAPKFPPSQSLHYLLATNFRKGDKKALAMAQLTLDKMSLGGMYDHLAGGFHRYSTDKIWLAPHFEKMLYDNGQLVQVYLEAWTVTGNEYYLKVAEETLEYTMRDMQGKEGGYYSSQDADSEKVEGKYYTWEKKEVDQLLSEEAKAFGAVYDVTAAGNFDSEDGRRVVILNRTSAKTKLGKEQEIKLKKILLNVRSKRIPPLTDDKVLSAWNGLMITAMARAYKTTREARYLTSATKAATFIMDKMKLADGRLLRSSRLGKPSQINGFLDDHANMIEALTELYECDYDPKWLKQAKELAEVMEKLFKAEKKGGYFYTANDGEKLIARSRAFEDNAVPNGNATACWAYTKLAALTGDMKYRRRAESILEASSGSLKRWPRAYMKMMRAADALILGTREIVIAGDRQKAEKWLKQANLSYYPCQVVLLAGKDAKGYLGSKKMIDGKVTAYICYNKQCKILITDFEEYKKALKEK